MQSVAIFQKFKKLQSLVERQGVLRLFIYLYQRIQSNIKASLDYQEWLVQHRLTEQDIVLAREQIAQWQIHPKFSVVMPVYNVEEKWLKKAIDSVRNQVYSNWELCIADDASSKSYIREILTYYSQLDPRIKVIFRTENGGIAATSNAALTLAVGEYIALLDHDDELEIDALFENAKLIIQHPDADFIYSDEDKIDAKNKRFAPVFKPDWSPEYLYATMYTCHLGVYRTSIVRQIGGFRSEYDGSQDYDLVLRFVEQTKNINHIPKILYHWRNISNSAASGSHAKPWAFIAGKKALEDAINRSSYRGYVEETTNPGIYRAKRHIIDKPLISIIILSAGRTINTASGSLSLLENCLRSIEKLSSYRNFEIIVVDGYDLPKELLNKIKSFKIDLVRCSEPFNFSMRINRGTAKANGEFLLLLNDDTEVINTDWLESMLEFAQQKEIGVVGAKLLTGDRKIQHTGVIFLNGNPCHAFYGYDGEYSGYHCSNIVNKNYLAVTGACLMIRKELFQQLGGMDENFPMNYNDVDLCLAAYQAGYRNVVTPYAKLIHYESISREKEVKIEELLKLQDKWKHKLKVFQKDPYYNPNLSSKNTNFELSL